MSPVTIRRQVLAGAIVLAGLRLVLSAFRTGPLLVADEAGYLTNARVLSGGVRGQMELAPFYHGGYSLVIAPLVGLGLSPTTTYHVILALNALLAGSLVPLLYLLLTRYFAVRPRAAVAGAFVGAAYPSVTVFSQVAMSENLLLPLFVVWLLCAGRLAWGGGGRWAAALGLCSAALYAVHGRMVVTLGLAVLLIAGMAARRLLAVRTAAAALVLTGVALLAVRRLDHFLVTTSYGGHPPDEAGRRLSSLESLSSTASVLRNLVGQSWYLTVATLALPLAVLARRDLRDMVFRLRAGAPARLVVLVLLLATGAGLLVLSALSFPDPERADMFVYGRYTEVIAPPLLALAVVSLIDAAGRVRLLLVCAAVSVATLAAVGLRETFDPGRGSNRWDVAGLPSPPFQLTATALVLAGVAALVWSVAAVLLARRRAWAALVVILVSFLLTTANGERNPVHSGEQLVYGRSWTSPDAALRGAGTVAYDVDAYDIFGLYAYQWFTPHTRFVLYDGSRRQLPRARYVISGEEWPSRHPGVRAHEVWRDPLRNQAIFRLG